MFSSSVGWRLLCRCFEALLAPQSDLTGCVDMAVRHTMVEKAKCDNIKIFLGTTLPALQMSNQQEPLCVCVSGAMAELTVEYHGWHSSTQGS